ncbi:63_t:CDS:10 [Funneliformis caledonium]|uniref:63_t:CDS:1 n=1 Tax=Funneliformis caledonium TaxID=1117310 RepID=A0A9N8VLA9_9GLOM|nr:63_t:CDS:10 [Funneliformis caledonium]
MKKKKSIKEYLGEKLDDILDTSEPIINTAGKLASATLSTIETFTIAVKDRIDEAEQLRADQEELNKYIEEMGIEVKEIGDDVKQVKTDVKEIGNDVKELATEIKQITKNYPDMVHNLNFEDYVQGDEKRDGGQVTKWTKKISRICIQAVSPDPDFRPKLSKMVNILGECNKEYVRLSHKFSPSSSNDSQKKIRVEDEAQQLKSDQEDLYKYLTEMGVNVKEIGTDVKEFKGEFSSMVLKINTMNNKMEKILDEQNKSAIRKETNVEYYQNKIDKIFTESNKLDFTDYKETNEQRNDGPVNQDPEFRPKITDMFKELRNNYKEFIKASPSPINSQKQSYVPPKTKKPTPQRQFILPNGADRNNGNMFEMSATGQEDEKDESSKLSYFAEKLDDISEIIEPIAKSAYMLEMGVNVKEIGTDVKEFKEEFSIMVLKINTMNNKMEKLLDEQNKSAVRKDTNFEYYQNKIDKIFTESNKLEFIEYKETNENPVNQDPDFRPKITDMFKELRNSYKEFIKASPSPINSQKQSYVPPKIKKPTPQRKFSMDQDEFAIKDEDLPDSDKQGSPLTKLLQWQRDNLNTQIKNDCPPLSYDKLILSGNTRVDCAYI